MKAVFLLYIFEVMTVLTFGTFVLVLLVIYQFLIGGGRDNKISINPSQECPDWKLHCPRSGQEFTPMIGPDFEFYLECVRDDAAGMGYVCNQKTAMKVIERLAEEGVMKPRDLLLRCCHFQYGEVLVIWLQEYFCETGRLEEYVSALSMMKAEWWEESEINPCALYRVHSGRALFAQMLMSHFDLVTNPESQLYCDGEAVADEYWTFQVRYFIVNTDYRRAWDEIIKARTGLRKASICRENFDTQGEFVSACRERQNRCWGASKVCVSILVDELFTAMCKAHKLVKPSSSMPTDEEVMVMLADHFRALRNEKRKAKRQRKAGNAAPAKK